jgi:viologen exporter family transport system permease protein
LKAYLSIVRLRFAVQLQYRAAAAAAFFTNFFFGIVRVMVYHAFYASTTTVQPLTLEQAVTYTWLTQVTFRMQPWTLDLDIINLIRTGNIAYEFCRPLNLYFIWYSRLISFRLVPTLLSGIPVFICAYVLPGGFGVSLPASAAAGAAWIASNIFALLLGCAISSLVNISTLWTIAGDGMVRIFPAFIMILSGVIIPLAYFPDWMQTLLTLLPFSSLVDIPMKFYLGILSAGKMLTYGMLQVFWLAVFILAGLQLFNLAARKVTVQGG